jgi:glycosyltransferase involved in cell wall biosynthesis
MNDGETTNLPVCIISFNRPDYLEKVLDSLLAQERGGLRERRIALFQDGAIGLKSGRPYGDPNRIRECIEVFKKRFPSGDVHDSSVNLGVARNFERAETYAFDVLRADSAVFLEDDLVLGRNYFETLEVLIETFRADDRVAYVAAYGDHTRTRDEQLANKHGLITLTHNWGFAVFRRAWIRMRPKVLQYLRLIDDVDYQDREAAKISSLFRSWGYGTPAISQDAAKTIACCASGMVKLNTFVCNATYIGETGLHMNQDLYAERGYGKTEHVAEMVKYFEPLNNDLYGRLVTDQLCWAMSSCDDASFPGTPSNEDLRIPECSGDAINSFALAGLPKEHERNALIVTSVVTGIYRALLNRDPDAAGLAGYGRLLNRLPLARAVETIVREIRNSVEYSSLD